MADGEVAGVGGAGGHRADPAVAEAVRALARASRLLELTMGELTLSHYRVLSAVAAGDQRASRVAARLAVGKPTISATVEALCQRGLLLRSGVDGDQRAAALRLSAEGESVLARVEAEMAAWLTQLCDGTPDRDQVLQALGWMGTAMDKMAEARRAGSRR